MSADLMSKPFTLIVILATFTRPIVAVAQATVVWDQQNLLGEPDTYFMLPSSNPVGQQFIPTFNGIDVVGVSLGQQNNPTSGAHLQVHIHSGTDIFGPIVGSSQAVNIGGTASGNGFLDFVFPQQVALIPGNTYVFEVRHSSGDPYGLRYSADSGLLYPNGQAIVAGSPVNADLIFREGVYNVPEPSITWLSGLGVAVIFLLRRIRAAPRSQCI